MIGSSDRPVRLPHGKSPTAREPYPPFDQAGFTAAVRKSGSAKEIARAIGTSVTTAARYRNGPQAPAPEILTRLMRFSHHVAEVILKAAGLDDVAMDLEEIRLVRELQALHVRREASHGHTEATAAEGRGFTSEMVRVGCGDA